MVTFSPSETEQQVQVVLTDDSVFECDEIFQGVLSLVTGSEGVAIGPADTATATIEDDDSE